MTDTFINEVKNPHICVDPQGVIKDGHDYSGARRGGADLCLSCGTPISEWYAMYSAWRDTTWKVFPGVTDG